MLSRCFPKTDPEWTSTPLLPSSRQNRVVCDRNRVWRLKITQNHTFWNEKSHNHTKLRHRPVCDSFQEGVTKKLHLHISKLHLHKSGRFLKPSAINFVCDSFQQCVTTKITQSHQTQNHTWPDRSNQSWCQTLNIITPSIVRQTNQLNGIHDDPTTPTLRMLYVIIYEYFSLPMLNGLCHSNRPD